MSQLPPPNFVNFPVNFYNNGFPAWPVQGASPSIFAMPPIPHLSLPPRFPIPYPSSISSQLRLPSWPNMNHTANHVAMPSLNPSYSPSQRRPQDTNFQAKTSDKQENNTNSFIKEVFSCDACQKEFNRKETLNAHLGSHVVCSYDGCSFKASRKMLKLHWIQVHASGKMRIKLDTPEEIAKWREERKRKYPTVANVEKKKEEEAKRQACGQVLKTKNFRYRRGQRGGRTFQRGGLNRFNNRHHHRRGQEDVKEKLAIKSEISELSVQENGNEESQSQETKRLQNGGDPLAIVLADCDEEESDTEYQTKERLSPKGRSPSSTSNPGLIKSEIDFISHETDLRKGMSEHTSALTSLCSAYASDSDEYEKQTEMNNNQETSGVIDEDLAEKPEIRKELLETVHVSRQKKHNTKRRSRKFQRRNKKSNTEVDSKSLVVRKSTLLEKLLAPEMRHERNVILQCLRYIIKKNFFGVEQSESSPRDIVNH